MTNPIHTTDWHDFPAWVRHSGNWFVVSDTHGRLDALEALLALRGDGETLIHLGDIGDKGPDTAGVYHLLDGMPDAVLVQGNHDLMLRYCLIDHKNDLGCVGGLWRMNGREATLDSFDSELPGGIEANEDIPIFKRRAPDYVVRVIRRQKKSVRDGSLLFVHAGVDPSDPGKTLAMPAHEGVNTSFWSHIEQHYTWMGRPFMGRDPSPILLRGRRLFVIHGHVQSPTPDACDREDSIDVDVQNGMEAIEIVGGTWRRHWIDGCPEYPDSSL